MINYKIIDYLKDEIKISKNLFDNKDLEILARYIFNNKKLIDLEDISGDIYDISVLKFAIRRRIQKEPISQIIGLRKFWNSNFYIDETVLDPRPESELIVEKVLELSDTNLSLIDLGTGSGCLAISIALERPNFKIFASDISPDALKIAEINSRYHKTPITFIKSDWFSEINNTFDIIIANPPYISEDEYKSLPISIRRFEPKIALTAGINGLDCFKKIIMEFHKYLKPNGIIFMEIGYSQKRIIEELFIKYGYENINFFNDLSGKARVVCVKKDAI
jgi:release factor glutamine methyltransferase